MRACVCCGEQKEETDFGKFTARPNGRHNTCKSCVNDKSRKQRELNPEKTKATLMKSVLKRKNADPAFYLWKKASDRVKYEYEREFTITPADVIIPKYCPYLGIELNSGNKDANASLDRIDSTKGYVPGNVQVISLLANQMKNRATKEQLIAFAKGVLAVHTKEV